MEHLIEMVGLADTGDFHEEHKRFTRVQLATFLSFNVPSWHFFYKNISNSYIDETICLKKNIIKKNS